MILLTSRDQALIQQLTRVKLSESTLVFVFGSIITPLFCAYVCLTVFFLHVHGKQFRVETNLEARPTVSLGISEPQNQEIDELCVVQECRATDFEGQKL